MDEKFFLRIADAILVATISKALGACGFSMFLCEDLPVLLVL
jgi:hypothetical protein